MTPQDPSSLPPNPEPCLNVEITPELVAQHGLLPEEYGVLQILGRNPTSRNCMVMWSSIAPTRIRGSSCVSFHGKRRTRMRWGRFWSRQGRECRCDRHWRRLGRGFQDRVTQPPERNRLSRGGHQGEGTSGISSPWDTSVLLTNSLRFGSLIHLRSKDPVVS